MDMTIDDHKDDNDMCVKKKRKKRQKLLLIELFLDFADNIEGLKYVVEKGLSAVERIFWLITFILSVWMCFLLIRDMWIKWRTSPVIVSFNEQVMSVGKVPFPSVTICPQVKCLTSVYNYSVDFGKYINVTENNGTFNFSEHPQKAWEKFEDISLVCDQGDLNAILPRNFSNSTVVDNILEVAPSVEDILFACVWRYKDIDCENIFKKVLTSEGVCYNFNALSEKEIFRIKSIQKEYKYLETAKPSKNWSVTEGYTMPDPDPYPRRGRENGASPDLELLLVELRERDGLCNILNKGYKIYVQHPADFPQNSLYYYAALSNQVSSIALKVNMVTTADSLKDYPPEIRQCYFPSDRPLRYFNVYSPSNCRLECQANYTFQSCGCVWFHMPHEDSTTICTAQSRECVIKALDELSDKELEADLGLGSGACRCLPSCYSVTYDAEILKTGFDLDTYIKTNGKIRNIDIADSLMPYQFSKIEMYFKEPRFVSVQRSELFGLTDFLANCGGLLGLFLGFSFLGVVEIAYFLTLRLWCTLRRDLRSEGRNCGKRDN